METLLNLSGKVVLVTGGNSGLGLGFAQGCARQGADIIVWGRRAANNEAAAEELRSMGGGTVLCDAVDVRIEEQVMGGIERAVRLAGRIDCVFVNAGIMSVAPSFPDMTSEMYHALMAVNLHGAFYTLREVCRHMRARARKGNPGGSLVICGSLSRLSDIHGLAAYLASDNSSFHSGDIITLDGGRMAVSP